MHTDPATIREEAHVNDTYERDGSPIAHFRAIVGHDPWPWQRALYTGLVDGAIPDAVDIPTGLGKTVTVLLVLLARLRNPELPRRVVYIVDRRAIVDQTAAALEAWIERIAQRPALARAFDACAAFRAARPVGLGVLRGGLADDGAWRLDPARPAVIVGTVDMVGSRLLFAGYGDGRWSRPLHAGMLGHDAMVVLDEAHLAPAMGALLGAMARLQGGGAFRTITLSATGTPTGTVCGLTRADLGCAALARRVHARKSARFVPVSRPNDRIAAMCAAALAQRTGAVVVFVERVADATRVAARLLRGLGAHGAERVALLTGTLRARERAALGAGAVWRRFVPERDRTRAQPTAYLVATAAGEVGVDLDADHAVMDLSTLDSMIQRIGRVNRTGAGEATITVVFAECDAEAPAAATTWRERRDAARARTLAVLRGLPEVSPATLHALDGRTLEACAVREVEPARLDAAVVEAFAATSSALPLPPVGVYLRGVAEAPDPAETYLAWRWDVAELAALGARAATRALAFHRPRADELARVPTPFARRLLARALARRDGRALPMVVAGPRGEVFAAPVEDAAALPALAHATVLLPPDAGGLTPAGLPDPEAAVEVADVADDGCRIRYVDAPGARHDAEAADAQGRPGWLDTALELRLPVVRADGAEAGERWLVYARRRRDASVDRGAAPTVDAHCARVAAAARRIANALGLRDGLVEALEAAGRWHDRGKARAAWQRAAGAPAGAAALAKAPRGAFRAEWLAGYRHEFGSLADAERALDEDTPHRELILHLVAAHHGWARPGFPERAQWDPDATSRANEARAVRTAHRFARLQAHYGPWRLAWLEALLKAADARVSSGASQ